MYKGETSYQSILIFDNPVFGRVLVLEGIVQLSEKDEFIYHEMLVHPVLFSHPKPERVLIVGGGDGGTLREVLKHPVKEVVMVDVDKRVVELSKKYLSFVSNGAFEDKRTNLVIGNGLELIKKYKTYFDIIFIDGNDEVGAATELYGEKFYKDVYRGLKKDGMVSAQIGSISLDFETLVNRAYKRFRKLFPFAQIFKLTMPSYHCGEYGFVAASKQIDLGKVVPQTIQIRFLKLAKNHAFRYYSPGIHAASTTLPLMWKVT